MTSHRTQPHSRRLPKGEVGGVLGDMKSAPIAAKRAPRRWVPLPAAVPIADSATVGDVVADD